MRSVGAESLTIGSPPIVTRPHGISATGYSPHCTSLKSCGGSIGNSSGSGDEVVAMAPRMGGCLIHPLSSPRCIPRPPPTTSDRWASRCRPTPKRAVERNTVPLPLWAQPCTTLSEVSYNSKLYRSNRRLILAGHPPCSLCGEGGANTVDHIIPRSRGGDHSLANLRPAHLKCNSSRGNRVRVRYSAKW